MVEPLSLYPNSHLKVGIKGATQRSNQKTIKVIPPYSPHFNTASSRVPPREHTSPPGCHLLPQQTVGSCSGTVGRIFRPRRKGQWEEQWIPEEDYKGTDLEPDVCGPGKAWQPLKDHSSPTPGTEGSTHDVLHGFSL